MVLAELAAIGGAVLDIVSATANTAVNIAQVVFDLLAKTIDWTMQAVQQLFNFETSQPTAFFALFAVVLAVFVLAPIALGVNYNSVLFGTPAQTQQTAVSPLPTMLRNLSDAEITDIVGNIRLAYLPTTPDTKMVQIRTVTNFFGTPTLMKQLFPSTTNLAEQELGIFLYLDTMDNARVKWANQRYQQCGKLAYSQDKPDNTVWEMVVRPADAKLSKRMVLAQTNPYMRAWNASVACYSSDFNDSTNMTIPGATMQEQVKNLRLMMENGSICEDVSFEDIRPTINVYSSPNPLAAIPLGWINLAGIINSITGLQQPTSGNQCYIMYNATSHERYYTGVPYWLKTVENSTVYMVDGDLILSALEYTPEETASMKAINFNVTTQGTPGILTLPTMTYNILKTTTNTVTGGATEQPFYWFETAFMVLLLLIIGMVGVILVLNVSHIKQW